MVEQAHRRYKEPEIITVKTEAGPLEFSSSKDEPIGELEELMMEVPESLNKTSDDVPDTNDDQSCDSDKFDFFTNESQHSDPFDDADGKEHSQDFTGPISTAESQKSHESAAENDLKLEAPVPEKRKRGRKPKNKSETSCKEGSQIKSRKPKSAKDKAINKPEEESAYKIKMKSFDEEIAQYMGLHCDVCNIAVENFAGVKNHMRTVHNIENGYVKCCDKMFYKRANLLHHIRHHVDPNCYRY